MDWLGSALDVFLHLDQHLNAWAGTLGPWLYLVLFLVVFCETGLVVTPFLPGDSLLFAVGALVSIEGSPLSLPLILAVLWGAAVLGDAANYAIGHFVGPKVFSSSRVLALQPGSRPAHAGVLREARRQDDLPRPVRARSCARLLPSSRESARCPTRASQCGT